MLVPAKATPRAWMPGPSSAISVHSCGANWPVWGPATITGWPLAVWSPETSAALLIPRAAPARSMVPNGVSSVPPCDVDHVGELPRGRQLAEGGVLGGASGAGRQRERAHRVLRGVDPGHVRLGGGLQPGALGTVAGRHVVDLRLRLRLGVVRAAQHVGVHR